MTQVSAAPLVYGYDMNFHFSYAPKGEAERGYGGDAEPTTAPARGRRDGDDVDGGEAVGGVMAGLSLEGKPWYVGLIVGLVLAVCHHLGRELRLYRRHRRDRSTPPTRRSRISITKIEQGRAAQRKLPQFREEVNRLELELKKLRSILPSTRNTEEIIKKIKSLVDAGNFVLRKLTFPHARRGAGKRSVRRVADLGLGRRPLPQPGDALQSSEQLHAHHQRRADHDRRAAGADGADHHRRLRGQDVRLCRAEGAGAGEAAKPGGGRMRNVVKPIRAVASDRRRGDGYALRAAAAGRPPTATVDDRHDVDAARIEPTMQQSSRRSSRSRPRPTRITTIRRAAAIRSSR